MGIAISILDDRLTTNKEYLASADNTIHNYNNLIIATRERKKELEASIADIELALSVLRKV